MVVDRHEDYWTRDEKRERETGTSALAGGIFIVIIALIVVAFAMFGLSRGPDKVASPPAATDDLAATH